MGYWGDKKTARKVRPEALLQRPLQHDLGRGDVVLEPEQPLFASSQSALARLYGAGSLGDLNGDGNDDLLLGLNSILHVVDGADLGPPVPAAGGGRGGVGAAVANDTAA